MYVYRFVSKWCIALNCKFKRENDDEPSKVWGTLFSGNPRVDQVAVTKDTVPILSRAYVAKQGIVFLVVVYGIQKNIRCWFWGFHYFYMIHISYMVLCRAWWMMVLTCQSRFISIPFWCCLNPELVWPCRPVIGMGWNNSPQISA